MYIGEFHQADSDESEIYAFDFRRDLVLGESITSVSFELVVIDGVDASVASRLVGLPTISGSQVRQRVAGLLAGNTYKLEALAVTNQSNTKSLWGRVSCKD
jgi:hypothetical protein